MTERVPRRHGFDPRPVHGKGVLVDNVEMGWVFRLVFQFSLTLSRDAGAAHDLEC